MTLTRADAEAYLAGRYARLLAEAQIVPADIAGGLKEPLDDAFRAVGVLGDLGAASAPDADSGALLDHASRAVLSLIVGGLASRTTGPNGELRESPHFRQAKQLLDTATSAAAARTASAVSTGSISFGFLQPDPERV